MKAKVSLKTVIVSALLLVCGLNASADNKSNLIYNSEGLLLLLSDCKLNKVIERISALPASSFPTRNRLSRVPACDMPVPSLRLQFFV